MKDSFVFYKSFYDAIKNMPDELEQAKAYNYIFEYVFEGKEPQEKNFAAAMFYMVKVNIDNAIKRYEANVENGRKGGRPKKIENPTETQPKPKQNPTETQPKPKQNLNDNDNINVNDNNNKYYYNNEKLNNLFLEFLQLRKKIKAVNSERAINSLLKTLEAYDDATKYKMIEKSITNSWKDVYPLKENKGYFRTEKEVPEWLNKNIDIEVATDKERQEIEEMLKEYK
jgi:hypothetical protein